MSVTKDGDAKIFNFFLDFDPEDVLDALHVFPISHDLALSDLHFQPVVF